MRRNPTAENTGYKVVDEFGYDISGIVWVHECANGKLAVIDEFEHYITRIVKVFEGGVLVQQY